jgi:hypothetical protein
VVVDFFEEVCFYSPPLISSLGCLVTAGVLGFLLSWFEFSVLPSLLLVDYDYYPAATVGLVDGVV